MALALNRYLCTSVLPLLISYGHYFDVSEKDASMMESVLNTVYMLCKVKGLTTGQQEVVCNFLISFTNQMKPPMMKNLLKNLIIDLPTLEEYTIVPLKMLTLWYERCGRYYGDSPTGIQASEEEKRSTMTLFTRIFDALANTRYDPELFSNALPCLSAIGCALSPDYTYVETKDEDSNKIPQEEARNRKPFEPKPIDTSRFNLENDLEESIKVFSEHVHDTWAFTQLEAGWSYNENYDDLAKVSPMLKPYSK
jgi:ryanodine receptor 2